MAKGVSASRRMMGKDQQRHAWWRGALICTVLFMTCSGCATLYRAQRPEQPQLPGGGADIVFISNTSPVDFDDLEVINPDFPHIEGFFDEIYETREISRVLSREMQSRENSNFAPEAEWIMVFEDPLSPDKDELSEDTLKQLKVRFQGMVEGKWLYSLENNGQPERNHWIPASMGNNFYDPKVKEKHLPVGYMALSEWDRVFSSDDPETRRKFDDARVTVCYKQKGRKKPRTLYSSFGEMRKDVFAYKSGFLPSTLFKRCALLYCKQFGSKERNAVNLVGINLGAHGAHAALVNSRWRQTKSVPGALLSCLAYPKSFVSRNRFRSHIMRTMAADLDKRSLHPEELSSLSLSHQPVLEKYTLQFNSEGEAVNPFTGAVYTAEEYAKHVKAIVDNVRNVRDRLDGKETSLKILVFVHGGLNTREGAVERAHKLYPGIADAGYYPVFINWECGLRGSYLEDVCCVRRGEKPGLWPRIDVPLSAPVHFTSDIGRAVSRAPIVWWEHFMSDIKTCEEINLPKWVNRPKANSEALNKAACGLGCKVAFKAINEPTGEASFGQEVRYLLSYLATLPAKLTTSPIVDSFGKRAWGNMLRRTKNLFHKPDEFDLFCSIGDTEELKDATCQPPGGGLSQALTGLENEVKDRKDYEITLVTHSMGAIIGNEIIDKHPGLNFRNIVYMAAACSIRGFCDKVVPYLKQNKDTQFYNLMLHPQSEVREYSEQYLDLGPRGSLLVWIDSIFSEPNTVSDRTLGRHENIMRCLHVLPEDVIELADSNNCVRERISLKTFKIGVRDNIANNNPEEHGQFDDCDFWTDQFRKP